MLIIKKSVSMKTYGINLSYHIMKEKTHVKTASVNTKL